MDFHDYRIFYFKYFDPSEKMMVEPYVFELDPRTFHVVREISASRARWQPNINAWVWERGVARDICGVDECKVQNFTATTFPEITETPDDFLKEVKLDKQMNYQELAGYIRICSKAVSIPSSCMCSTTRSLPCRCSR